jgi:VWFA-related protein
MTRLRTIGFVCVFCLLGGGLLRATRAGSQDQPAQDTGQGGQIRVQVNLVNLFATVRDKHKAIVTDLTQNDFKIYEDNVEQKIAFFQKESDLPITLGILIDTSLSEGATLPAEQQAAEQFLRRVMRKGDLAMVISFDLDEDLLADFTDQQRILDDAIDRAKINAGGGGSVLNPGPLPASGPIGTNFYDALYLACHDKLADEAGRKAVVVLTDANDNGSKMKIEEAIEAAQRTDTVVHILLVYDPAWGPPDFGGASKITNETGGRTIVVRSEKNLQAAFDEISEELRSQYTLGYYPTNPKHDGSYRKIKVEVTRPDTNVLTRKGYYAPTE